MTPDEELRALIRQLDPVPQSAALSPARIHELKEQAMRTTPSSDHGTTKASSGTSRRRGVVLGAGALALAASVLVATGQGGGTSTRLEQAGADPLASCAAITVEALQGQSQAFRAEAVAQDGDVTTFEVTDVFKGDVDDTVEVAAGSGMAADYSSSYEVGKTYLVSASGGQVGVCGLSGAESPELTGLYEEAFGGS